MPAGTTTPKWLLDFRMKVPPVALVHGTTVAIDASLSDVWTLTTTGSENTTFTVTGGVAGQTYKFIITSDSGGSDVLTFGTGFRVTGTLTLTASKVYVVEFVSDGTSLIETSRTTAIT